MYSSKYMDDIREKLWKEQQQSPLSLDIPLLTGPVTLDNNLAELCLKLPKLYLTEQNDNDVYILWLTNEDEKEFKLLNDIKIKIYYTNDELIDFISEIETSNIFLTSGSTR